MGILHLRHCLQHSVARLGCNRIAQGALASWHDGHPNDRTQRPIAYRKYEQTALGNPSIELLLACRPAVSLPRVSTKISGGRNMDLSFGPEYDDFRGEVVTFLAKMPTKLPRVETFADSSEGLAKTSHRKRLYLPNHSQGIWRLWR